MENFPNWVITDLILEKIRFEYATLIPPGVIANLTVEQVVDFETKAVKTFFRTFILGREVKERVTEQMKIYNSWWDHFKGTCLQPYLPIWLIRYFPGKYHLQPVVTKHFHLCPHTGIGAEPDDQGFVHIHFLEGIEPIEPENWMKPFIKISMDNQFGPEKPNVLEEM